MRYYQVKAEKDQCRRSDGSILIGGELYTARELEKFKIRSCYVIPVEVSKKKIYFFFGARFKMEV